MRDPTQRFSDRVDNYIRCRPSYPGAVVDLLQRECGLTAASVVADIGSGPGNLTRLFLDNGNTVFGVEPNRAMREAGERLLQHYPGFHSVDGAAEATTLPGDSFDAIAVGQAFHWFDHARARGEFRRILRAPRWVTLVWNERRVASTPFLAAYEQLLLQYGMDYAQVQHRDTADAIGLGEFFAPNGYAQAAFENSQVFDFEGLQGRLLSSSYAPAGDNRDTRLCRRSCAGCSRPINRMGPSPSSTPRRSTTGASSVSVHPPTDQLAPWPISFRKSVALGAHFPRTGR